MPITKIISDLKYTLAEINTRLALELQNPSKGQVASVGAMMVACYDGGDYYATLPGLTPELFIPRHIQVILSCDWHDGKDRPITPTIHTYVEWLNIKKIEFENSIKDFELLHNIQRK